MNDGDLFAFDLQGDEGCEQGQGCDGGAGEREMLVAVAGGENEASEACAQGVAEVEGTLV